MQYLARIEMMHFNEFLKERFVGRPETEEFNRILGGLYAEYNDYMENAVLDIPERITCTAKEFFSSMEKYLSAVKEFARIDGEIRFGKQFTPESLRPVFNEKEQELDICQFKDCPPQLPKLIKNIETPDVLHQMLCEGVFDVITKDVDFNADYNHTGFKRVTSALNETVKAYSDYQQALSGQQQNSLDMPAFMYESVLHKKLTALEDALSGGWQRVKEKELFPTKSNLAVFPSLEEDEKEKLRKKNQTEERKALEEDRTTLQDASENHRAVNQEETADIDEEDPARDDEPDYEEDFER